MGSTLHVTPFHQLGLVWAAIGAALIGAGCSKAGFPSSDRRAALKEFSATIEPEILDMIDKEIFATRMHPKWTKDPQFGFQESNNLLDNPYARGDNLLREGVLDGGVPFWAEGYYSYGKHRFESATLIIDYPSNDPKAFDKNEPITAALLSSVGFRPSLISSLMKGLGKGSMSGGNSQQVQARAEMGGKTFEVSTAIARGKPLKLELKVDYTR
jgi:hypothetical protein